jgi:hypothetical protein
MFQKRKISFSQRNKEIFASIECWEEVTTKNSKFVNFQDFETLENKVLK